MHLPLGGIYSLCSPVFFRSGPCVHQCSIDGNSLLSWVRYLRKDAFEFAQAAHLEAKSAASRRVAYLDHLILYIAIVTIETWTRIVRHMDLFGFFWDQA